MNKILQGDCLIKLKELEDNSIDSIVTDPPYELGFMGKGWDSTGIANNKEMWAECLRVLKPGGHLLAFSGTRTYHRMAVVIEYAGFEVRDMIEWVYGSGFPKSLNLAKYFEKEYSKNVKEVSDTGASSTEKTNHVVGVSGTEAQPWDNNEYGGGNAKCSFCHKWLISGNPCKCPKEKVQYKSEQAKQWEGWGTALKPAHEPICMARKPLAEKTVAENVLKYGTGGINIDESRVEYISEKDKKEGQSARPSKTSNANEYALNHGGLEGLDRSDRSDITGRFPANLIHDNSEEVRECFPETKSGKMGKQHKRHTDGSPNGIYGKFDINHELGETYGDSGNASRFFKSIENDPLQEWAENEVAEHRDEILEDIKKEYGIIKGKSIIYQAKASKSERNKGCEELEEKIQNNETTQSRTFNDRCLTCKKKFVGSDNTICHCPPELKITDKTIYTNKNNHPTVKPIALMEYLIKMVTPKGGVVLDPFAGSGSTLVAAKQNGYQYIGIEMTEEYIPIIEARLKDKENTLFQ